MGGGLYLQDARRNVDPAISEFRGLEYFAQRKVLFDYNSAAVIVADQGDEVDQTHSVAEFAILGPPYHIFINITIGEQNRKMIFNTGTSITDYLTESIATTGSPDDTIEDFYPKKGKYIAIIFKHSVEIGGESVDISFRSQPEDIDQDVRSSGAVGIIGIGLYKNFQVLLDFPNKRLVLGKFE